MLVQVWRWVVGLALAISLLAPLAHAANDEQVAQLTQLASRTKNPEEAIALLKQALELDPNQPDVHLNYAGVLFRKGQATLEAGKKEDGRAIFRDVEKELLAAIRFAKNEAQPLRRTQLKAQANFLLGDVNFYAFNSKEKAKGYYQEALWYDPQHAGALAARTRYHESLSYTREPAPQPSSSP
jgi:tetratricopeptide (TPR) repeat protein